MTYSNETETIESATIIDESKLAYYDNVTQLSGLTAAAQKVMSSPNFLAFCQDLVSDLDENGEESFTDYLQGVIEYTSGIYYTLGELMASAPLAQQRGLSASTISKLLADANTGVASTAALLRDPEVCVLPSGGITLIGGNHRVALLYLMALHGGADEDSALSLKVRVLQSSINMEAISNQMTTVDENGDVVYPLKSDVLKEANKLVHILWVASNQSRTMVSTEIKDAKAFSNGVDRTDASAILAACFGDTPIINSSDAVRMLARLAVPQYFAAITDDAGNPISDTMVVPAQFEVGVLRLNTFESCIASGFAALSKISQEVVKTSKDGSKKYASHKVWSKDAKNPASLTRLSGLLTKHLDMAITDTLAELSDDNQYKGNVARNAAAIGKTLADIVNTEYEPSFPYEATPAKAKASKVKPRTSRSLAI